MADTAEEVRKEAAKYYDELTTGVHDMLLAYADLLEAQPELLRRLRAAEAECATRNDEVSGLQGMLREAQARIAELEVENRRLRKGLEDEGASEQECDAVNVPRRKP